MLSSFTLNPVVPFCLCLWEIVINRAGNFATSVDPNPFSRTSSGKVLYFPHTSYCSYFRYSLNFHSTKLRSNLPGCWSLEQIFKTKPNRSSFWSNNEAHNALLLLNTLDSRKWNVRHGSECWGCGHSVCVKLYQEPINNNRQWYLSRDEQYIMV